MGLFSLSKEEPVPFEVRTGEKLTCRVCTSDLFFMTKGQLNTAAASFFGMDWTNPTAACVVCSACGFIHWFLDPDEVR